MLKVFKLLTVGLTLMAMNSVVMAKPTKKNHTFKLVRNLLWYRGLNSKVKLPAMPQIEKAAAPVKPMKEELSRALEFNSKK